MLDYIYIIIESADIFKGNSIKYGLLDGGFVNKTYKLECSDKIYCVRINNSGQVPFLGLDSENDTFQNNILYDGDSICIIDWEYCGYGDGFFDFAHFANCVGMTDEDQQFMLKTYFGYFEPEMWEMLRQMKYISDVYDATWYIFHACIVDYEKTKNYYIKTGDEKINNLADS